MQRWAGGLPTSVSRAEACGHAPSVAFRAFPARDFLPEDMDYEELRSAYADVLGRWGQRVREAVARNELLFPGDVEAGGDPGYLDEEARAAMLRALRDKLAREEKEWASLADQSRDSAARVAEAQGTVDEHQRAAVAAAKKVGRATGAGERVGSAGRVTAAGGNAPVCTPAGGPGQQQGRGAQQGVRGGPPPICPPGGQPLRRRVGRGGAREAGRECMRPPAGAAGRRQVPGLCPHQ